MIKALNILAISLVVITLILAGLVYLLTFHPAPVQSEATICPNDAPLYSENQPLKVVSYNVQYMAGKDYVFFYDLLDNSGPDTRPSPEAIQTTLTGIADLINTMDADVLLLQELHDNNVATDHQNQTELMLEKIGDTYPCYSEAYYWKAGFVPLPEIMGSVGMKLVTLSKYRLENAERHQLSLIPSDPITQAFNLKRAVLTTELPTQQGNRWTLLNTHLDAFSQGTNTMAQQVEEVNTLLQSANDQPWIIGGDFNLLAAGEYEQLEAWQQAYYNPQTELTRLHDQYRSVPSLEQMAGPDDADWYTHFPNDPRADGPDRTIDYLFYSPALTLIDSEVVQGAATTLSDHLPVVGVFQAGR